MNRKFKVLDLFCGAGGLSLGFSLSGFEIVGGIDFNKQAIETHKKNFSKGVNICGNIRDIDNKKIKELFPEGVDVIVGGPPCQGFSSANQWQSEEEKKEKNMLFYEYMRFVKVLKPKIFLIENVRQILTNNNSYAKKEIMNISNELGYDVNFEILNASHYGVPQKRIRAFIVGIRKDLGIVFDFSKLKVQNKITVKDAISDLYDIDKGKKIRMKKTNYQNKMRKNSSDQVFNHEIKYPMDKVQRRMEHVPQGGNWRNVPTELWETQRNNRHSSAYRRLDENDISITIDTGHMNYFHPLYNRVPTVRESARIQSFPDDFIFMGTKTSQFLQVGNAVPPLLAKALADEIKTILSRKDNK